MTASATPSNPEPLVQFDAVSVDRSGTKILSDIDFKIDEGEHWVLVGPNGAGKTTLARVIVGREYNVQGDVNVLGEAISEHDVTELASRVGFASLEVGQRVQPHETVMQMVMSSAWGQAVTFDEDYERVDEDRAKDLLGALGVGSLANRLFSTLSEGERRRVLLARALMADPEILILDEPTAGLDLAGREILVSALSEIMGAPSSPAIILITHELEEIGPNFTHAATVKNGKITAAGPIETVLTDAILTATFDLPLTVHNESGRWHATAAVT